MIKVTLRELENSLTPERIIELVAELGGKDYIDKPDCIIFKTICHNIDEDDASFKLYYYKNNKRFFCYTDCGESFDIFGLFQKRYELLGIEYNFYRDIVLKVANNCITNFKIENNGFYNIYESDYNKYKKEEIQVNLNRYNDNILNIFSNIPPANWLEDGINEEVMKVYGIKYSISKEKIIIPHYDEDNNLIGIRGRALREEDILIGKYMPVQIEDKIYSHPLAYNLYGLNIVKDNLKKMKMAIIFEGEKAPMQYATMFGLNKNIGVACCGSNIHKYQIELLVKYGVEKILIAFDKEGENWKEKEKYYNKLLKICNKYKQYAQMGFIFDTENLLNLKDSPTDRGREVYTKLYKRSVWVK